MSKFNNPLNNIKIASPCSADWNQMVGDERRRFCGDCQLNVYNLSGMTRDAAENLLMNSEGCLCVRFYRRTDGTILTKECPVGWQALKKKISKTAAAFASLLFGILSGLGLYAFSESQRRAVVMGATVYASPIPPVDENEDLTDAVFIAPKSKKENVSGWANGAVEYPIAGGITNVEEVRRQVKQKHRR